MPQAVFDITGMHCAGCVGRVEKALKNVSGVRSARVNLALERADMETGEGFQPAHAVKAVEAIGYGAVLRGGTLEERRAQAQAREERADRESRYTLVVLTLSLACAIPFLIQMVFMIAPAQGHMFLPVWVQVLLATLAQVTGGWRFTKGAYRALKSKAANMDVLVALGTWSAYLWSLAVVAGLVHGAAQHVYFEASTAVTAFVLLGKYLEVRARSSASAAVRALERLQPRMARRQEKNGEVDVPVEQVKAGDILIVRPGERIAADGQIVSGHGHVNEMLITGESIPMAKNPGDKLIAGALNGNAPLVFKAIAIGDDTQLARISRLVEQAQIAKAPVQRFVDQVSMVFVPVVVGLAALTFIGWLLYGAGMDMALGSAVAVLVIACPCALGLATPVALVAGTGAGARAGILVRDISAIERGADINAVIFDKTGTLTRGSHSLHNIAAVEGIEEDEVLRVAAALEQHSEHPLGVAVRQAAREREFILPLADNVHAFIGGGLSGDIRGQTARIGNTQFITDVNLGPMADVMREWQEQGQTVVLVERDRKFLGLIGVADTLREQSEEAVRMLQLEGVKVMLLSGDAMIVARAVAASLGIEDVHAPVKPTDKARTVHKLREEGLHVAMVGDGVNDAPALAAADLGIAMGSGADVAREAAGIVLMRPDPRLVPAALDLARLTRRKIRQNLFWAFAYNVAGLPLAAFGLLSPVVAGAAMALSSVCVVGNALLLMRWRA
jgi:Cu+-exporting ATPase